MSPTYAGFMVIEPDGTYKWVTPEEGGGIMQKLNAFDALLAVAKAAAVADLFFSSQRVWDLSCRLVDIEVAHPGWREWQP